jgi:diguanylate cyclase (GGDEF)-like protein
MTVGFGCTALALAIATVIALVVGPATHTVEEAPVAAAATALSRDAAEAATIAGAARVARGTDRIALEKSLAVAVSRLRVRAAESGDTALAASAATLPADPSAVTSAALDLVRDRATLAADVSVWRARAAAEQRSREMAVALLAACAATLVALAALAVASSREARRLDAALPPGAPGEDLAKRAARLSGKRLHAVAVQATLAGERVELARSLAAQRAVEDRLRGEVRENRERIEKLEVAQMMDELTGVLNFRYFLLRLDEALEEFVAEGREFCLLALDLDDFKGINDGYGHHVGDTALKEFAAILRRTVRREDVVFRKSGDEFYVLMPGAAPEHGEALAERLLAAVDGHEIVHEAAGERYRLRLGTSIGVLHCGEVDRGLLDGLGRDQLLSETYGFADAALFKAKFSGKGCARVYRTGLTVQGVNPKERPPEFDQLHRELRARYPLLPDETKDEFNAHIAACRAMLAPGRTVTRST